VNKASLQASKEFYSIILWRDGRDFEELHVAYLSLVSSINTSQVSLCGSTFTTKHNIWLL